MIITFTILSVTIFFFLLGRPRSDVVATLSLLALALTGVLSVEEALSGFSDATVIMIATLFVVAEGLSRTGVTAWLSQQLLRYAGRSEFRLLVVLMAGTAFLSAFVSNTGTTATLLPAVVTAAWHIGSLPSKFLIPLAFAANSGGLLTLTGTPPNFVVSNVLIDAGLEPFGYFEYALIGLPLLIIAIVYMALLGRRLLPSHKVSERPEELSESMTALTDDYILQGKLYSLRVRSNSDLVGQTLARAGLGRDYDVSVLRVARSSQTTDIASDEDGRRLGRVRESLSKLQPEGELALPKPDTLIQVNDLLLVKGERQDINRLVLRYNLGIQPVKAEVDDLTDILLSHEVGLAEVLIAPRSVYIGRTVSESHLSAKFGIQVLRVRRRDTPDDPKDIRLAFGDALLVRGTWGDIDLLRNERRNFVVVGSPEAMAKQVVRLSSRSLVAVLALLLMIALMVSGVVHVVIATIIAALVMVLGRCLSVEQAYRSINWGSVILVAGMIPMSLALQKTGGADFVAAGLVNTLGAVGPMMLMAGIFLLTSSFSQVMSNTATAVLMMPIVMQASSDLGLSPYPLLMTVAISASTAFLTPIGTATNLMVAAPGGYSFKDYIKVGGPLILLFLLASLALVPLIWPW
ncbi:MAG: SLC13 family permease [Anaerolineae bacterium]|nr:MAG: SLC13 family permease [Anaerolineae bacterium]